MDIRLYDQLQAVLVVGPILGLLLLGLFVSLRSAGVGLSGPHGVRLFLGNLPGSCSGSPAMSPACWRCNTSSVSRSG